jgi:cell division protein FtsZ
MGIGRASGENRAIQAAQQAVESPLLEVSIDGARGILFNIIGGDDLSMHEINAAAEAITAAADPDANIIFGATISPDLDGEVIITVVATGFDASYFAKRQLTGTSLEAETTKEISSPRPEATTDLPQEEVAGLDMSLDEAAKDDFASDSPMPNIWNIDEEENPDDHKPDEHRTDEERQEHEAIVSGGLEDELERPSFLRRLSRRRHESDSSEEDKNTDK